MSFADSDARFSPGGTGQGHQRRIPGTMHDALLWVLSVMGRGPGAPFGDSRPLVAAPETGSHDIR
jgi:hypothetical protein